MQHYISQLSKLTAASGIMLLAACAVPQDTTSTTAPPTLPASPTDRPADAPSGTCWGSTITPAVIQTTTERILIAPADISAEGTIRAPARYQNEDRQTIVRPRQTKWHEIVCTDSMTPAFLASLQRALSARGFHQGDITGQLDTPTKDAIALYQTEQNLPGYDLTVEAAQRLGLVVTQAR